MKINPSKNNIVAISTLSLLALVIIVVAFMNVGSSVKKDKSVLRLRRSMVSTTSSTIASSIVSTTKAVSEPSISIPAVAFIPGATFLDPATLQAKWKSPQLCSLLPIDVAKDILEMTSNPACLYFYSESAGAKGTFNNGDGDEIKIQISTSTYASARTVEIALGEVTETVQLANGAVGVLKSSKTNGYSLSLDVYGETQNEVLISAPSESAVKKIALIVTNNLKLNP